MLPRIQNVFPVRELYNSNPCRDMWDSQQISQTASGSQGSQKSSSELFSQSRMSQQKGFSSLDVWSQPTGSQQQPEQDEPMKYYMKYMTQPPLFSTEPDQQKPQAANYREFIEIQKKKTAERDDRDVLDSFISLLKDYTKEVKTAMDSFKDSIDTTLASKAEQVATAASQSAELIRKLKEDLLECFGCLRKDLKENEELKGTISKQTEKIAEQGAQIKMLQTQLEDCRNREIKAMEKQDKYLEREDKMLQKLEELSSRQLPASKDAPSLTRSSNVGLVNCQQPEFIEDHGMAGYAAQNASHVAIPQCALAGVESRNSVKLHHMPHQIQHGPRVPYVNMHAQSQGQFIPMLDYRPQCEISSEAAASSYNQPVYCQTSAALNQPAASHPTAAIAPMRPVANHSQPLHQLQERQISVPSTPKGDTGVLKPHTEAASATEKEPQEAPLAFASPGVRAPCLTNGVAWPKQSPIAAVHPQIRVKRENAEQSKKAPGWPCAKKARKDDPFDIFMFDLTSSSEEDNNPVQQHKDTVSIRTTNRSEQAVKTYGTRSKKNTSTVSTNDPIGNQNVRIRDRQKNSLNQSQLLRKVFSVKSSGCNLRSKSSPALTSKVKRTDGCADVRGYYKTTKTQVNRNTPNRPAKAILEDGIPKAKADQTIAQRPNTTFKRNVSAAKRTLSFDASLFDVLEDSVNIQQITESIRKHARRRKTVTAM